MGPVATWEDGPEYAPVERPADFSPPAAGPPLDLAPSTHHTAARAPVKRPAFERPDVSVVPLAELVPAVADQRDPVVPFEVVSSTVTSMDSAWGAAHWSPPNGASLPETAAQTTTPFVPTAVIVGQPPLGAPTVGTWGPPTGAPWPVPTAPVPPPAGPVQTASGFPPPGTPQWFGPGPGAPQQQRPPAPPDARAVVDAATPGLLICLAIGGFIYIFAPIMLVVAFFLSQRVLVAAEQIRRAFLTAIGFLGIFALVGLMGGRSWFTDWWAFVGVWALVISWTLLITVPVVVYRALKNGAPKAQSHPSSWG
jgi:hypothetical protein